MLTWIQELASALNEGILPAEYYALSEQQMNRMWPDVIALEISPQTPAGRKQTGVSTAHGSGFVSVAQRPPHTSITGRTTNVSFASLRKTIVIRHAEGHNVVALIEILSRGNKASRAELEAFLEKYQLALKQGIHLLLVDLYPPGKLDPSGIHGQLWAALGQEQFALPEGKTLLSAAYESGEEINAYVEPFRVGDELPQMPLFLDTGSYVDTPLVSTYERAFARVPRYWRESILR